MGSVLSNLHNDVFLQQETVSYFLLLLGGVVAISIIFYRLFSSHLKWQCKRFIRIQIRKRLIDPLYRGSNGRAFDTYYQNSLCYMQKLNTESLAKILQKNYSCAFFLDRSISFLSSHRPSSVRFGDNGYVSIDEFRAKVPLTTYDDYREYVDRMIVHGEKNLLSSAKVTYFATSSGTTGKIKFLPVISAVMKQVRILMRSGSSVIWTSLPPPHPSPEQRAFQLYSGKKSTMFPRSKDDTPIGPIGEYFSAVSSAPGMRFLLSTYNALPIDLVEGITDFETSAFVQLVFALAIPDLFVYSVTFASVFIHTIKIIEKYFEEMSLCIANANFDHSSLIRGNIHDSKFRTQLNRALDEVTIEYGGLAYRLRRAEHIRQECLKRDLPGLCHRLWPNLAYASTTTGGSFAIYKKQIEFYCGTRLPVTNMTIYAASEGSFGFLASIYTDEYILSPTSAFFEFIREEDIHQAQPTTLLISEIQPGNRYELVCTTEAGLIRYRMGDVVNCTRFLCRSDDLVPLPAEPLDIPRIPLISIAYRVGSLLNVIGEKTTEQHIVDALERAAHHWQEQGIIVRISDFTSYPKLDVFPPQYVIFLELSNEEKYKMNDQQLQYLQNNAHIEIERQLCKANLDYKDCRKDGELDHLACILVRNQTFSTFLHKELVTDRVNPIQIKPHRLLKSEHHIQFFNNNQINHLFSPSNSDA